MKPFIRTKVINGIEYLYEITPYYDPEQKKTRQKSKYLGKKIDNKPVRVRDKKPKQSYTYGEFLPFVRIIEELKVEQILNRYVQDQKKTKALITLALNRLVQPLALQHIASWYEGTYFSSDNPHLPLSSSSLSSLLDMLGTSNIPSRFFDTLVKSIHPQSTFVYDITSLCSYSRYMEMLEYGYCRDGLSLPQVNLSLVMDHDMGIPVMYELYPGSIVDVSTLLRTLDRLEKNGVQKNVFIMDRGFYSATNIEALASSKISYIIGMPFTSKQSKELLEEKAQTVDYPQNLQHYNGKSVFVEKIQLQVRDKTVRGYCYYFPQRKKDEEIHFYNKLNDIRQAIETIDLRRCKKPEQRIRDIAGKYRCYISYRKDGKKFKVTFCNETITSRIKRMGIFMLVYGGQFSWDECLSLYRSKDIVEKGFDLLKNDLEMHTPQMHKESTFRGYLFVHILALTLRMRLQKILQETELSTRYSIQGIITELKKLTLIELSHGEKVTVEKTKRQKDIIKQLKLCA